MSVDFGVKLDGWCGDAAETFVVGEVADDVRRLVEVTRNSLAMGIEMCRPGEKWSTVARAMQGYVEEEGFSVVRDLVGHGIGTEMHEDPKVPNFFSRELEARDIAIEEGLDGFLGYGIQEADGHHSANRVYLTRSQRGNGF